MSDKCIDNHEYIARRAHKRRCYHCGGEIRIGDVCVRSRNVFDGRIWSFVEHEPCNAEAQSVCKYDDGLGELELITQCREDWSPEYAAWYAMRNPEEAAP